MTAVTVSFAVGNKTVSVQRETAPEEVKATVRALLSEVEEIALPDKATSGQFRALWAKAVVQQGWDKEKVKSFLQEKLGTSRKGEIVGVVDKARLSGLIDELADNGGPAGEAESAGATSGQLRALWARALGKGWNRDEVRAFLEKKLGCSDDAEIVGKVGRELLSGLIDELAAA